MENPYKFEDLASETTGEDNSVKIPKAEALKFAKLVGITLSSNRDYQRLRYPFELGQNSEEALQVAAKFFQSGEVVPRASFERRGLLSFLRNLFK